MEKENSSQSRKRTRDHDHQLGDDGGGGGDDRVEELLRKEKRPEIKFGSVNDDDDVYSGKGFEFSDGVGVFDFPWLKEGVFFEGDEWLETPFSCLDEVASGPNLDQINILNIPTPGEVDGNVINRDDRSKFDDHEAIKVVDDLEPVDCIWSSIMNQPLDIGLLDKV